ncbi:MAG: molybdopterin-dependent oxidoreductase [Syntrophales bacterium LBB04]|nr:molybdopterin-dependent oxidoreductase [Syntrophales bacterium LBB04]
MSWQLWWIKMVRSKRNRGMKIIVVDPRCTEATEHADLWLPLRAGTDGALAMGWLNIIINEGLYDKKFVEEWTIGFDKLKERAQEYPVEKVARITGLKPDDIIKGARMFAEARPSCCICYGVATDMIGRNATVVEHARVALRAILGSIDVAGGTRTTRPGEKINGGVYVTETQMSLVDKLSPEQRRKALGYDISRITSFRAFEMTYGPIEKMYGVPPMFIMPVVGHQSMLWPAILEGKPYPIKALICNATNTMAWAGPTKKVYDAFKSPNLEIHIEYDFFMTPSGMLADYVFPGASWMERYFCSNYLDWGSMVFGGDRAIPPLGERRDAYEFWRALAIPVGQKEHWPWETAVEVNEYRLKPMGISFKELVQMMAIIPPSIVPVFLEKKYEKTGFPTRSGKVELYSSVLEELGYDPLPYYEEPAESPVTTPEVAKEYPLVLSTGGRRMPFYHSEWMHWDSGGREKQPDALVEIHPDTARSLGINEGDWVYIETKRGRIKQKALFNHRSLPDYILAQSSWWYPERPAMEPSLGGIWESNANVLVLDELDACDRLSGGFQARALLCKVYKA